MQTSIRVMSSDEADEVNHANSAANNNIILPEEMNCNVQCEIYNTQSRMQGIKGKSASCGGFRLSLRDITLSQGGQSRGSGQLGFEPFEEGFDAEGVEQECAGTSVCIAQGVTGDHQGGDAKDGNVLQGFILFDERQDLPAIHFGDLHVQQDPVRGICVGLLEEFCACVNDIDLAAEGLQCRCDGLDGGLIVFNKQNRTCQGVIMVVLACPIRHGHSLFCLMVKREGDGKGAAFSWLAGAAQAGAAAMHGHKTGNQGQPRPVPS